MEDTDEEYLLSKIKVEEEQLESNRQESTENVNQAGFVAGSSAANMAEAPSCTVSLSSILEQLTAASHEELSTVTRNSTEGQETEPFTASCESQPLSSRNEIPPTTKHGKDMTGPEYRDFMVSSFTTLIGLTNKLCGIMEKSVNFISQVLPAIQLTNQVHPACQVVLPSQVVAPSQISQVNGVDSHVIPPENMASKVDVVNSQVNHVTSQVNHENKDRQVIPNSQVDSTSQVNGVNSQVNHENKDSQVDGASQVNEVTSQVNHENKDSQVIPSSQVDSTSQVNGVNSQVNNENTDSQVNPTSQVQPDCKDLAVNSSDPLAIDEEIGAVANGTAVDVEELSQSQRQTQQSITLKQPAIIVTKLSDNDVTGTKRPHAPSTTLLPPKKKMKVQKQPDTSAFSGRVCSYKLVNTDNLVDPENFWSSNTDNIVEILEEELIQKKCIKVVLLFKCKMKKVNENGDSVYKTGPKSMYRNSDITAMLREMYEEIMREFTEGSGLNLEKICELVVRIAKFSPLKGGTYIKTPEFIQNRRCVVNVVNRKDNRCFEYSILVPYVGPRKFRSGPKAYQNLVHDVNFKGLPMPMPVHCISKFEQLNPTYSVNVYVVEGEIIHPIRVTEMEKENHRDLLLLKKGSKFHYCCITNLSRLISKQLCKTRRTTLICKTCLTTFYNNDKKRLEAHKLMCNANIHTSLELSKQHNDITECKFRSYTRSYKVPFVVYADILRSDESMPLSVACYVHTNLDKKHCGNVALGYKLFHGENSVKQFVSHMESVTENVSAIYKNTQSMDQMTREKQTELSKQTICHICDREMKKNDETSTDFDHLSGEIRGRSHVRCNLNFRLPKYVPVILQRFDTLNVQNLISELADGKSNVTINACKSENYISFQKKIGMIYVRFLDSCNFMGEKLYDIVKMLPTDTFKITDKEFQGQAISLMNEKVIFGREYIKNIENIRKTLQLPLSHFGNTNKPEYEQACKIWRDFGIRNLGEFCNHHLKSRVTFLADVFEHFRNICMKTFNLDPCNYHRMEDMTFDSILKISQVELELLSDHDMFDMIEAGIRGNFVQMFTRYAKANNEHCEDFDRNQPTSHLAYFKANHIYATQMLKSLPVGDFSFVNPEKFNSESIMKIPDDGKFGYIFEVSLKYPQNLHDPHSEHPLCQTLQSPPNQKVKGLMGTLEDKENYVVHFRVLQQALQSDLVLKKVHRVLKFKQSKWLKPYIEKITQLRQEASDEFSKRFYESALNSIHAKFLEDVRDKKLFTIVHTEDMLQKKLNKYHFLDFHIYSENCVAVIQEPLRVTVDHPVYVGMVILDLVKMQMNHFFYDVMKKHFGKRVRSCYTDTGLFILSIESQEIDAELFKLSEHFDLSNYPPGHLLYSDANKEKLGTFKNMAATNPIVKFVGVWPKNFALKHQDLSIEDSGN